MSGWDADQEAALRHYVAASRARFAEVRQLPLDTKTCPRCDQAKSLEASFHHNRRQGDGHHSICKDCIRAWQHARTLLPLTSPIFRQVAVKRCSRCDQVKLIEDFYRNSRSSDGREGRCKICSDARRLRRPRNRKRRQLVPGTPMSEHVSARAREGAATW